MARVTGAMLRVWRQWAGWDVPETARQLRRAAGADPHIASHDSLVRVIRRRERENAGVSERYVLLYARALGVPASQLSREPSPRRDAVPADETGQSLITEEAASTEPVIQRPPSAIYSDGPGTGRLGGMLAVASGGPAVRTPAPAAGEDEWIDVWELVMAAADESGERAATDGGRAVSSESIVQVQADVQRLARSYSAIPPLAFLAETRHSRDLASRLAARTRRPVQMADLYMAAGQACALMSVASFDLAVWSAAVEQANAALIYGEVVDHPGLQAWARGMQALIAYWCGREQEAVELTGAGLALAPPGTARARLHSISARAWSHMGAADRTREALAAADRERDLIGGAGADELHDRIGGEFGWGPARQAMCSASALLRIGDADGAADRAAEAIHLHAVDQSGSLVDLTARADLARAELARGRLDAAHSALNPVWQLVPEHRRYSLVRRLEGVAGSLTEPRYVRTRAATGLVERIKAFTADSAPRALPASLEPPPPGGQ